MWNLFHLPEMLREILSAIYNDILGEFSKKRLLMTSYNEPQKTSKFFSLSWTETPTHPGMKPLRRGLTCVKNWATCQISFDSVSYHHPVLWPAPTDENPADCIFASCFYVCCKTTGEKGDLHLMQLGIQNILPRVTSGSFYHLFTTCAEYIL